MGSDGNVTHMLTIMLILVAMLIRMLMGSNDDYKLMIMMIACMMIVGLAPLAPDIVMVMMRSC